MDRKGLLSSSTIVLVLILSGCAPAASSPLPTAVATNSAEDTAVREAKQSYLNYINAANEIRFDDESTWNAITEFTTERRQDADQKINQRFKDLGWTRTGLIRIFSLDHKSTEEPLLKIVLRACVDSSEIRYFDSAGAEQTLEGADFGYLDVTLVHNEDSDSWLVDELQRPDGVDECGP